MGAMETLRYTEAPVAPRLLSAVLGAWLFASTFLWKHSNNAGLEDWLVGLLVLATALAALYAPQLRWASTFLAAGLGLGALVFAYPGLPERLHDVALAGAVGALSLVRARIEVLTAQTAGPAPSARSWA